VRARVIWPPAEGERTARATSDSAAPNRLICHGRSVTPADTQQPFTRGHGHGPRGQVAAAR